MIAIPAVDLRDGACVQLVGGSPAEERVRIADPSAVARHWRQLGFRRLHVVDLDAAMGRGNNLEVVLELVRDTDALVQVGGGVRERDTIEHFLAEGAAYVLVGTRAVEEPDWLAETAAACAGNVIVAADVRDRRIVTHGWTRTLSRYVLDVIDELNELPLGGVLVTAVHREGLLAGTDLPLMEDVAERSEHPVFASGGITTMSDLRALADSGVAAAVLGMALYTGVLDARAVAEEFSEGEEQ